MKRPRGIIVLEGADCSGKTTLANVLRRDYGARYMHGRVFPNMWKYHTAMLRRAIRLAETELVVIDRLFLSELVYGAVFRGGPAYDVAARCFDRVMLGASAVTVLCVPIDLDRQVAMHAARADEGGERFRDVRGVIAAYADLLCGNVATHGDGYLAQLTRYGDYAARDDVVRYAFDSEQGRDVTQFVTGLIRKLAHRRRRALIETIVAPDRLAGYVGVNQTVMLLTKSRESVSISWPGWVADPSFERGSMLDAVNTAVHAVGMAEESLLWINFPVSLLTLAAVTRGASRVIAWGAEAAEASARAGIKPLVVIPGRFGSRVSQIEAASLLSAAVARR
jgi:hypothetical protein